MCSLLEYCGSHVPILSQLLQKRVWTVRMFSSLTDPLKVWTVDRREHGGGEICVGGCCHGYTGYGSEHLFYSWKVSGGAGTSL